MCRQPECVCNACAHVCVCVRHVAPGCSSERLHVHISAGWGQLSSVLCQQVAWLLLILFARLVGSKALTLSQGTFGEAAPSFSRPTLVPLRMGTHSGEGGGRCIGSPPLHCPGPASLPPPSWVSLNTSEHPPLPAAQSSIRRLPDQEASAPTQPPAQGTAQSTEGPPVPCGPRGDRQLPAPGAGWPKPQ